MKTERWNVGQPGGPNGPFWSVVSSSGRVIAMQITEERYAKAIAMLPDLMTACWAMGYVSPEITKLVEAQDESAG